MTHERKFYFTVRDSDTVIGHLLTSSYDLEDYPGLVTVEFTTVPNNTL